MFKFDWMVTRMVAGVIATSVVAVALIGLLMMSPQPVPPIKGEVKFKPDIPDGVFVTYYFAGILKEEWAYENGVPQGLTRQYYPNASLFRELQYADGKLEGPYREYHEKRGRGGKSMRLTGHGKPKANGFFTGGKRDGRMEIFYPSGILKEEREYQLGKRVGTWTKYHKDGRLKSEKTYEGRQMTGLSG